ncbi:hypothetical protein ACFVSN_05655 [Kitasatospora sp. NPDC057904]|uniref:hypothetical protein n=1 Tax=unclassified Kitasatospora TaxID=2633591 RepID=UPI0036DE5F70
MNRAGVAGAALLAALALTGPAVAAAPTGVTGAAPKISRSEEIARARTWLTADHGRPVPYDQNHDWTDGWREDCSGYVSMALKLPKAGPNTVGLKNDGWTKPIPMSELKQGDLVIKADSDSSKRRHVVIFDRWTDARHTAYESYEQAGGVGTRTHVHTYGLDAHDGYQAYHPVNLTD